MARIIWTDSAIGDLRAIGEFYSRSSPEFAGAIVTDLYESVGRLADYPQSGRVVPELDGQTLRELIHRGFRIIYEVGDDELHVLTVLHARQDLAKKWSEEG